MFLTAVSLSTLIWMSVVPASIYFLHMTSGMGQGLPNPSSSTMGGTFLSKPGGVALPVVG